MAGTKKAGAEEPAPVNDKVPPSYEADTYYRVQLAHPIQIGHSTLGPSVVHTLLGSVCTANAGAIDSATKVNDGPDDRADPA